MFEKEADEYSNNWRVNKKANLNFAELIELRAVIYKAHKDGAEFAYKANEWHDLRKDQNDLPKENMKQVMVITNYNECLMGWYCIHQKTWYSSSCPDPDDYIETEDIMKVKVIAWKEIVLPELKESE